MRYFLLLLSSFLAFNFALKAQSETDQQALHQMIETMITGWNSGSGEDYSSVFSDDHTYIVWDGMYFPHSTRASNAAAHEQLFKGRYQSTRLHYTIDQLVFLRPDVAILHVLAALDKADMPRPEHPEVLFSVVAAKDNGEWQIVSFHNSDLELYDSPLPDAYSPIPVRNMYSSWYTSGR